MVLILILFCSGHLFGQQSDTLMVADSPNSQIISKLDFGIIGSYGKNQYVIGNNSTLLSPSQYLGVALLIEYHLGKRWALLTEMRYTIKTTEEFSYLFNDKRYRIPTIYQSGIEFPLYFSRKIDSKGKEILHCYSGILIGYNRFSQQYEPSSYGRFTYWNIVLGGTKFFPLSHIANKQALLIGFEYNYCLVPVNGFEMNGYEQNTSSFDKQVFKIKTNSLVFRLGLRF
jgi:hypothetical protein